MYKVITREITTVIAPQMSFDKFCGSQIQASTYQISGHESWYRVYSITLEYGNIQ